MIRPSGDITPDEALGRVSTTFSPWIDDIGWNRTHNLSVKNSVNSMASPIFNLYTLNYNWLFEYGSELLTEYFSHQFNDKFMIGKRFILFQASKGMLWSCVCSKIERVFVAILSANLSLQNDKQVPDNFIKLNDFLSQ